jgi:formylglycine-generating enzyme required for sulfatase activity
MRFSAVFLVRLLALALGTAPARGQPFADMVLVPAGPFAMGIDHPQATDERPAHRVELSAYYLDRHEVTNAQFAAFVKATGHRTAAEEAGTPESEDGISWRRPFGAPARPDHPVVYVTWRDAWAYCAWKGGRLPTEAEWEKSARGTDGRLWPWGRGFDPGRGNFWGVADGYEGLAPVGAFPGGASPYGVLDLAGNVWEWCADWYGENYYATGPAQDPQGPEAGTYKVLRGGSWINHPGSLRAINRFKVLPVERSAYVGFRCARSP